jgi:hypothetical protein
MYHTVRRVVYGAEEQKNKAALANQGGASNESMGAERWMRRLSR